MNRRRVILLTTLLAGLAISACSDTVSRDGAPGTTDTTGGITTEEVGTTSTAPGQHTGSTATVTTGGTGTGSSAAGSTTSSGDPVPTLNTIKVGGTTKFVTTTTTTHLVITTISLVVISDPRVLTLTANPITCAQAAFTKKATINWTTANAKAVEISTGGHTSIGYPPNGSSTVAIGCGQTVKVTVTAVASDGKTLGTSKTITITAV